MPRAPGAHRFQFDASVYERSGVLRSLGSQTVRYAARMPRLGSSLRQRRGHSERAGGEGLDDVEDAHGDDPARRAREDSSHGRGAGAALLDPAAGVLAAAIVVWTAFSAGGFFPDTPAWLAAATAVLLVLRVSVARHPFEGITPTLGAAIAGMGLLAGWTLLSSAWSDAPGRALIEFDRVLAYTLVLVLFASLPGGRRRTRWLVWSLAGAFAVVGAIALTTRLLPGVWPIRQAYVADRLSYPLTYWNAVGIFAAIGCVLNLHLACSEDEPVVARCLGAAAAPMLAVTLYFTFSKGAIGALAIGGVLYLLVGRPRALVTGLPVVVVAAAAALHAAYGADKVSSAAFRDAAARAQGKHVATVLAIGMLVALMSRLVLAVALDGRLARARPGPGAVRAMRAAAGVTACVVVLVLVVAGVPGKAGHQVHLFFTKSALSQTSDTRSHLTDPSNNYRVEEWDVSLHAFRAQPLRGSGAGTYQINWARERPRTHPVQRVTDGHSLYLEVLGELGIVGIVLVAVVFLALLAGLVLGARRAPRAVPAALLAALVTWMVHAGIDWDWEMPAVTAWLFAAGGTALAAPAGRGRLSVALPSLARTLAGLGGLLLAILPVTIAVSELRLRTAVTGLRAGNCATAIDAALGSISALSIRPEPYEVLGFCDARVAPALAVQMMQRAVDRDPHFWEYHYGLAVARGAVGRDPRPELRTALALDPLEPVLHEARVVFAGASTPRAWRDRALRAPLPD